MYVIPLAGRSVPDPVRGDILPEKGRFVVPSTYWLRRLACGEVSERQLSITPTPVRKGARK
ncbi:DUF2635 domain-containing protein [Enterobacterales bacterium CwR94]|nr:DUF2635 domain-containing protein [Enterobacterales bacterium CwR94]